MQFSLTELQEMLLDIGIPYGQHQRIFNGRSALIGSIVHGHPTLDITALGSEIEEIHPEAMEMSLKDWLKVNSHYPLEKWKWYCGVEE